MPYARRLLLVLTSVSSLDQELAERLRHVLERQEPRLRNVVLEFLLAEVSPTSCTTRERAAGQWNRKDD